MAKMRAVHVSKKGGPFDPVERDLMDPGSGAARMKVVRPAESVTAIGIQKEGRA